MKEVEPCNVAACETEEKVDCEFSEWGYWSECSKSCGGGSQYRERSVAVPPTKGGKPCKGELKEVLRHEY